MAFNPAIPVPKPIVDTKTKIRNHIYVDHSFEEFCRCPPMLKATGDAFNFAGDYLKGLAEAKAN